MLRNSLSVLVLASLTVACTVGCESDNSSKMTSQSTDRTMSGTPMPEAQRTGGADRYTDTSGNRGMMNASSNASGMHSSMSMNDMNNMKVTAGDKTFMVCAASSNKAEIAMAQMALKKSDNQQVKNIANHMISDHQMAQDQLMALAKQKGVDLDDKLAPSQETASYELSKLSGPMFDKQYLGINHGAHLEAIGQFQHASMHADDPAVRSWAAQILPKLEMHKQMIEQAMGSSMSGMNGMGNMNGMNHNMSGMNNGMNGGMNNNMNR